MARCCQLGTSPRACGWEAYLPPSLNRRSGARHQPLPYWQFLGRTPYIIPALRRPFSKGASARLLTRATHPFCRWKVSDTPVPSGEFHSTTQRDTRCYARYTRLRSCFPKGRERHRCEGVRRKDCGSAEDVLLRSAEVSTFEVCKPIVNG